MPASPEILVILNVSAKPGYAKQMAEQLPILVLRHLLIGLKIFTGPLEPFQFQGITVDMCHPMKRHPGGFLTDPLRVNMSPQMRWYLWVIWLLQKLTFRDIRLTQVRFITGRRTMCLEIPPL